MIRYGAVAKEMRPMHPDDLLICRLKLLIIMAKAKLKGFPLGDFRKDAVVENARFVFCEAFARAASKPLGRPSKSSPRTSSSDISHLDHLFLQRVQLLAVMVSAFVQEKSRGRYRKKAMADNVARISGYLAQRFQLGSIQFLKVA